MNKQRPDFRSAAAIVAMLLLVVVPLQAFFYIVIAALEGEWLPYKWDAGTKFYFCITVVVSLCVGGGITEKYQGHNN